MRVWMAIALAVLIATQACTDREPIVGRGTTASSGTPTTTSTTPATTTTGPGASEHPLEIVGDRFVVRDTGQVFTVRGTNYFVITAGPSGRLENRTLSPLNFDPAQVRSDFRGLTDRGYNTVRIFLECNDPPGCIGSTTGPGLDPHYLDVIVELMRIAEETDLMLLLTSNDLPDQGGYREISARDDSPLFPGYRNSDFLTGSGHDAMATYWTDLMTGLAERRAQFQTVLGWSILNEHWLFGDQPPLSATSGVAETGAGSFDLSTADGKRGLVVESTRVLIERVTGAIKAVHPSALVTMGFFVPQFPNPTPTGGSWHVDTARLVEDSDLDFFDFHFYANADLTMSQAAENFGIDDLRPVIMGEYGVFVADSPGTDTLVFTLLDHMARSCEAGFDGWIQWGYFRAPLDDATWAMTDAGGLLLDGLSPDSVPDPCVSPPNPNLAFGALVTATAEIPEEPASNAVDGTSSGWISGADAPQSIEIDLGAVGSVSVVNLVVSQYPDGRTVHRLELAGEDHRFVDVEVFDGATADGDVLRYEPAAPTAARYIRVVTEVSPSWVAWREIEVFGER